MPFESDEDYDDLEIKNKIKKRNTASIFDEKKEENSAKKEAKKNLHENISEELKNSDEKIKKAYGLTNKYKKYIEDKSLKSNKTTLIKQLEQDTISEMVYLADNFNRDTNEVPGQGSLVWIALLLKINLLYRDRLNDLEYELSAIKKSLKTLKQNSNNPTDNKE